MQTCLIALMEKKGKDINLREECCNTMPLYPAKLTRQKFERQSQSAFTLTLFWSLINTCLNCVIVQTKLT